jgi:hypothetical protein
MRLRFTNNNYIFYPNMRKFAISNPFRSLSEIKHSFLRLLKSAYKWQLWRKHYIQSILKSKTFCFCNLIHIRHFVQLNNFNDNNYKLFKCCFLSKGEKPLKFQYFIYLVGVYIFDAIVVIEIIELNEMSNMY